MSHLSASFSATIRVRLADAPGSFARLAQAIGDAGGSFGAIDLVRVEKNTKVRDVTVEATDADHMARIVENVRSVEGIEVERVSDRTFLMHLGGKIEMRSKVPVKTRDDLSMAYTPGVARICQAIADDPRVGLEPDDQAEHRRRRLRRDRRSRPRRHRAGSRDARDGGKGAAVQGVRRRRRVADLPRHEDPDEIVAIVKAIAPGFGGINLEDISAPRCFEIEQRLRAELDIPVFHDDQHGTAIVVLAALLNALEVVGKRIEDVKVVTTGRRGGRRRGDRHPPQRRRPARDRLRPGGRDLRRAEGAERGQGCVREAHECRRARRARRTSSSQARTSTSGCPCRAR